MPGPLTVTAGIVVPEAELQWRFSRSSGPGGQSVNTTDSRVELSFDLAATQALDETLKAYEADIAKLQAKLREARARQNAIQSRFDSAITRAKAREIMHGSRTQAAFSKFELLERRADLAEGRAEALGIGSLEDEIHELRAAEAVDRELEAMKAALKARVN